MSVCGKLFFMSLIQGIYENTYYTRFATELAGRKARRKGWKGLADEMIRAGWFE